MSQRITITTDSYIYYITLKKVLYCKVEQNESTFYMLDSSTISVEKERAEIEKLLSQSDFLHSHPAYHVNRNHIKQVDLALNNSITLSDNTIVPVSKTSIRTILEGMKSSL